MNTATRNNCQSAAVLLDEIGALATPTIQKLHRATFEGADLKPKSSPDQPLGDATDKEADLQKTVENNGEYLDEKIGELLDQIGQGFQADDSSNFEKLTIARKYGPILWELKKLTPHGSFQRKLQERFPKVNKSKCNRWMLLSKHEEEVAAAIEKYPEVAWGPMKMIDFLKERWTPEPEDEDDCIEEDEDDCCGYIKEDHVESESPLMDGKSVEQADVVQFSLNSAASENNSQTPQVNSLDAHPGATAGSVTQAVRTPPKVNKGKNKSTVQPAVKRTEFDVEVCIGFNLSVPEGTAAEEVTEAIKFVENWRIGFIAPFNYEMSEKGIVVNHVKPSDSLGLYQPEAIPE